MVETKKKRRQPLLLLLCRDTNRPYLIVQMEKLRVRRWWFLNVPADD